MLMQNFQAPVNTKIPTGILFGPGRSQRMPDPGTVEYKQLVERLRNTLNQSK
jgi:hypothetical protein